MTEIVEMDLRDKLKHLNNTEHEFVRKQRLEQKQKEFRESNINVV